MRILLVHPPCGPRTMGMRYIARMEPLGLELIGAAVSAEHDVRLVDMLTRRSDLLRTLKRFTPDVVGVTTEAVRMGPTLDVLRTVRRLFPECLTVVGGHHPTAFPSDFDDPAVDLIARGEGVQTFAEICAARAAGGTRFDHIRGLMIRTPDGLKATDPRPRPTALDDQPLPDRSLTARYRKSYYYITEPSAAGMRTSYGCRYNCSFCPNTLYSQGCYVGRDPRRMFDEIGSIKEPFIYFFDNGSFHDGDRMRALGQMLIDAGLKKRYLAYARADTVVTNADLFELWARAGLSIVMIGLEALDEDALERFNKKTTPSVNEQAVRLLEELGVSICAGFVIDRDATPDDFKRLDRYIKTHPSILHAEFTPLTPFPGTAYHAEQQDHVLSDDWQVYDFQHFVVKTRVPPKRLYRRIMLSYSKVIRRVVRRERLWMPHRALRPRKLCLLLGLIRNGMALLRAHRHVPEAQAAASPPRETNLREQHHGASEENEQQVCGFNLASGSGGFR